MNYDIDEVVFMYFDKFLDLLKLAFRQKAAVYDAVEFFKNFFLNGFSIKKDFCRIHKSYLVNLKYVKSVERYRAVLSNGKSLAISKARFLDTRNEFACYRGEI